MFIPLLERLLYFNDINYTLYYTLPACWSWSYDLSTVFYGGMRHVGGGGKCQITQRNDDEACYTRFVAANQYLSLSLIH